MKVVCAYVSVYNYVCLCVFLHISLWLLVCFHVLLSVWSSCCVFLLWNNLHLFHSIHPSNPLIICLSFYPYTFIMSLPFFNLIFHTLTISHPNIPPFTLSIPPSYSISVCLWLLWSVLMFWTNVWNRLLLSSSRIFRVVFFFTWLHTIEVKIILSTSPHQSGQLNTQAAEKQNFFVKTKCEQVV